MEIHLIIDGYNFIKNTAGYRCDWSRIQTGKDRLVDDLCSFNSRRNYSVTVVYDGWKNGGPVESYEKVGGIHIIHSRKGETADTVIMRMCGEYPGDLVVVTADREIISAVIGHGGKTLSPPEFQQKISYSSNSLDTHFDDEFDEDPAYSRPVTTRKKGPARRIPKAKRRKQSLLDRL